MHVYGATPLFQDMSTGSLLKKMYMQDCDRASLLRPRLVSKFFPKNTILPSHRTTRFPWLIYSIFLGEWCFLAYRNAPWLIMGPWGATGRGQEFTREAETAVTCWQMTMEGNVRKNGGSSVTGCQDDPAVCCLGPVLPWRRSTVEHQAIRGSSLA